MQLFRSEEDVDVWSRETGHAKGFVFSPPTLWALAQRWYGDRLAPDWRRRPVKERQTLLTEVGLTGPFWNLTGT